MVYRPRGFRLAVKWVVEENDDVDLLFRQIPSEEVGYWYGSLAQGAVTIHRPAVEWRDRLQAHGRLLVAHAIFVVKSRSGDAYPIHARLWYDDQIGHWWIEQVSRRSSIQVANSPPLVY